MNKLKIDKNECIHRKLIVGPIEYKVWFNQLRWFKDEKHRPTSVPDRINDRIMVAKRK